ncbi:hypothetical protein COU00_04000 [Candidatus Falkowbacteria bacterium CG10_big_fil_rev_8_21_14_0_10_43_11]|uniref:Uncharacterized protein n=1 Tax=Candidatus Falkowbacteria bacterium CG10_big_fil_rev_8_21_14_0_10_43_11 TaxID=1974568 RepID=A0A2M6WL44_9BACT|nr:MAG: hypothetical protein COU00_04000 [Candidatus Falkowbacteria bacterium CG10_big_fil_rev_8_21_14_0_10_43_11]
MKKFAQKFFLSKWIIIILVCFIIGSTILSFSLQRVNAEVEGTNSAEIRQNLINRTQNNSALNGNQKKEQIKKIDETYNPQNPSGIMIWVTTAVGWVLAGASMFLGYVLTVILTVLINVASFNKIIDVPAVITGWVVVRDLCNMFFVLILLAIAFGTILRIPSYEMKKALPKLLIVAVLINFSRTIFGLIIDFSQVVMLTFVNAFVSTGGGGNFASLFQLDKYLSLSQVSKEAYAQSSALAVLAGMIGAFIALLITTVVIIVLLAVLLMRVIMLWVYTILSPFVFFGHAFSGAQKYTSQIWGDFTKQVIVGPLLAFFIWLALVTAQSSSDKISENANLGLAGAQNNSRLSGINEQLKSASSTIAVQAFSDIYSSDNFQKYIITIALLIGGLLVAQQIGGAAGQMAGKGMGWIQKGGRLAGRKFTGYGMVADTLSKYSAMRKSARDQRITTAAEKLAYGVGTVKQGIGKAVSAPFRALSSRFTGQHSLNKKKKEREEMQSDLDADKYKIQQFENKHGKAIKNKEDFTTDDGTNYSYDTSLKEWQVWSTNSRSGAKTWQKNVNDLQKDMTGISDTDIADQEKHLAKIKINEEEMQKTVESNKKLWRGVGGVVGAGIGLVTGGLGWAGLAAALGGVALGARGLSGLNQKISDAGKSDLKAASNYRSRQIDDSRNENKNEDNETILATMDDPSKSVYVRAAAAMEATSRKIVDLDTAKRKREQIGKDMHNDKRVMGQFDAILEKNYAGATKLFKDLESTANPKDQEKADRTITQRYADGTHTMRELDNGSLKQSIKQLASGLKTNTFTRQYKDLSDEKKGVVKSALQGQDTYEAKEKLAFVTNVDSAFGTDATAKDRFIKNLTYDQLKDIIDAGDEEQKKALIGAVGKDLNKFSDSINNRLSKAASGAAKEIKDILT